jgi:diguanylate cyclase (GGDEF)-like protein/PAS domain S-box-containing protein
MATASTKRALEAELLDELRRSRAMLVSAQQLARIGSWEWDIPANVVTWSDELFRIYGLEPQCVEPTYEEFLSRVHPDDREAVDARNHKAFADHGPFEDVKRVMRPNGDVFLMRTQGEVICDESGAPVRMVGICEDVTDRVRADEAQALLASIVKTSHDAIYTISLEGAVTSWNPAAEQLFGYSESEAVGMPSAVLVPPYRTRDDSRPLKEALAARPVDPWETVRRRKDGSLVTVSLSLSHIPDAGGSVTGVSVIARDVGERRRFEAELRHLAEHDGLTGLVNRGRFEEELARAVELGERYGRSFAVLVLDLDSFKYVNDVHGRAAGDEVLRTIGALLRARLRTTDVIARLGGDEFAVLLTKADAESARVVARSLIAAVRAHEVMAGQRCVHVTTSVGGALFEPGSADHHDLLAAADAAMHAAKAAGRDRNVIFSPAEGKRARASSGKSWEHRIVDALDHGGFELHCQPILHLADRSVSRYELLLRMNAGGGIALPGAFLPVAERLGLIHAIDRWVAREAIRLLAAHPRLEFEVNLSGRSLDDPDLLAGIAEDLQNAGADPSRLVFEITETAMIANIDDARRFAESLAGLGCRFAIDDFGVGFGSFAYLKHLPVSYLKIDGEFVRSPRSRTDDLVIEAIVGMARGLGKSTIAEFVGDAETVEMLAAAGVDYAQGYHVGPPFPARELAG